jgi:hypothetical protein
MALPYTFGTQTGTIPLNELDENFLYLENLVPALAVSAGTVITASQPNITAVGTLTGLNCSGTVTAGTVTAAILNGTLSANAQPNITEIGTLTNLTVANTLLAGTVTATTVGTPGGSLVGTVVTAAQPNITSLGTLTGLSVAGTVSATSVAGTVTTAAQPNITSVGTLSSLAVSGTISGTLATAAQPNVTSLGTLASLAVTGNITGGNLSVTNIVGTVSTASQPNITALGTLTSLSVSGTSTLSGTVTAPTAGNGTSNTQVATTQFVQNTVSNASTVPSGAILLWSGSIASIPAGWFLCDGTNGTPNLQDRFVVGAGSTYAPAATGGSADAIVIAHTHTATSAVTDPGHNHSYNAPAGFVDEGFSGSAVAGIVVSNTGNAVTGITVATTVASAGASGTNANLPPYYALAYIMKS